MSDSVTKSQSAPDAQTTARPAKRSALSSWASTLQGQIVRFARSVSSREQIVQFLKNLTLVIPLTVLVWVYAESETVKELPDQLIPFAVYSSDPARVVDVVGMQDRAVMAKLSGSRSRLDSVLDLVKLRNGESPIKIAVDPSLQPGREHTLNIQQAINADPIFSQSGVSVANTSPPTLTVFVDKIVSRDVPVRVPPTMTTIDSVVFDPPTVRIDDAEQAILAAEKEGPLVAYVDLSRLPSTKIPGQHTEKGVKFLRPADAPHRTFSPAEVTVSFSVREANVSYTFRSMAVFVLAPANIQAQYKISYDAILPNVTVIGPPGKIELLKRDDFQPKPRAVLELTRDDVTSPKPKTLRFIDLPEGVTIDEASARREVSFTVTERAAGE